MKKLLIIVILFIATTIKGQTNNPTIWDSSLQNTNAWTNSSAKNVAIRNLIKGDFINDVTIRIAIVLKGRDDRAYTINSLTFAQREDNTLNILGNLIPVTFNGGDNSVTVEANTTITSDSLDVTLIPGGKDFFLTFAVPNNKVAEQKGKSSADDTSWSSNNLNDANVKDWSNISTTKSRHLKSISAIVSLNRGSNHPCAFIIKKHNESKTIDGRKLPYSNIRPGDNICLESGTRESLKIRNLHGTSEEPLTFINHNGLVEISTTGSQALTFQYCQYFRLTGTGDNNYQYGIKISKSSDKGIRQERKSNNSEIDHIEFANIGTFGSDSKGIGYAPNVKSTCPDGYNAGYDYNNDGEIDEKDIVSPENFAMENILFHDNYLHNIAHEGLYLGVSYYHETSELKCKKGKKYDVYNPEVKHVEVYNNIIENTGWEPIQVASATKGGCSIHHNTVKNGSLEEHTSGQSAGIKVKDEWGQSGIVFYDSLPINRANADKLYIFNNTIIKPRKYGINLNKIAKMNDSIRINNNIIVNPQKSKYINFGSGYNINTTHHNLETVDISNVGFEDPNNDNFKLLSTSSAIDAGVELSDFGIIIDIEDNTRVNQGSNYDIGAYEFLYNTMSTGQNKDILNVNKNSTQLSVSFYPNPAKNQIKIKLNNSNNLKSVKIYNNKGSLAFKSNKNMINVSKLPNGIYFIQIITSKGKAVKKIIINKN